MLKKLVISNLMQADKFLTGEPVQESDNSNFPFDKATMFNEIQTSSLTFK